MERRKILAWSMPVVTAVVLPAHGLTSEVVGTGKPVTTQLPVTTKQPVTTKPPVTTQPPSTTEAPGLCDDKPHKVELCHHPKGKPPHEICVAKPAAKVHYKLHNDYPGSCK